MPKFIVGARLHDYGKGSPDELFGRVSADGFAAVQLAYKSGRSCRQKSRSPMRT